LAQWQIIPNERGETVRDLLQGYIAPLAKAFGVTSDRQDNSTIQRSNDLTREFAMSVIGIGVDVIECSRIQRSIERFGERFLHRVFTDGEIEYSMSMKFPERHLAARFAGKEAVAKAFGTGIGKAMGWRNIDIRKKESGEPFLVFSGPAKAFAAERGVTSALITLSHTENYAVACAVLEGTSSPLEL
jgi:phosphopantethiene--protein transferase domain